MQPVEPGHNRTLRLWLTTVVLLVLLALIAIGSRDGALGHGSAARPTPGYIDWAMSVFLVLFVLMIPWAVYAYSVQMREFRAQRERRTFQSRVLRGFAVIAFVMLLAFAVALLKRHGLHFISLKDLAGGGHGAAGTEKQRLRTQPYNPTFRWPVLYVTLALIAVGGAIWWRKSSERTAVALGAVDAVADDMLASIGDAIDDLEAEPDARRAVIAAYARMEAVLARHGFRRRESETALEYLRRVLLGLTSRTDAVTRLTSLFEQAKFSRHEIDGTMKQDAISALRAIREDLQGAPA
jgi:hypothetical protein